MIQAACSETLEHVRLSMDELPSRCPVVLKLRNISIGIGIGVFIAGGSAGAMIMKLL